jgi:hypothetical protein
LTPKHYPLTQSPSDELAGGFCLEKIMEDDEDHVESAYGVTWYVCDHCKNLHLGFEDADKVVFAQATINREMIVKMLEVLDDAYPPVRRM